MKFCPRCKEKNDNNAIFCEICGEKLENKSYSNNLKTLRIEGEIKIIIKNQ